jgi:hypothetical protein
MSLICGVSICISDFVVFHISKVSVGFTSLSEPMCYPFEKNAPTLNCEVHHSWIVPFGQPENGDHRVLSGYIGSYVSFVCGFDSITLLFSGTPILDTRVDDFGMVEVKHESCYLDNNFLFAHQTQ